VALALTLACGDYDRTAALRDGTVQPEGIALRFVPMRAGKLFDAQAREAPFDASEFSLGTLIAMRARGDDRFVAIPVFPSRLFRHGFILVNAHAGVERPQDLVGRRVGAAGWEQTAALWIRAILQHEYGVAPDQVEWQFGGLNAPSDRVHPPVDLPPGVRVRMISPGETLSGLLERGELDALIHAELPDAFKRGSPHVRRLFPNYREVEADYYRHTGLFPIMHTVILRRELYRREPWVAASLYHAFQRAKRLSDERLSGAGALYCALPWLTAELEHTRQVMGDDYWPYGFAANRRVLQAMAEYSLEQGLIKEPLDMASLFAPETLAM